MIRFYTFLILFSLQPLTLSKRALADDLLDILDNKSSRQNEATESIFSSQGPGPQLSGLLSRRNAEQNIFFNFLGQGEFQKALYQWPSAFEKSAFTNSDNGKALYGYLLFKNGLEVQGIETLFTAKPQRIDKALRQLWQGQMQDEGEHWAFTNIVWSEPWTQLFGVTAEVKVRARRFDQNLSSQQAEALLRKTQDGTWERDWLQWQFAVALISEGKDILGAKILKNLTAKASPKVSKDLLWLTAARVLYQNGFLTESIQYYDKIQKASEYWYEAHEEKGWAYLRKGQPQNTIAITQSLLLDSLAADIGPMPFYQGALADLKVCSYSDVAKHLESFKARFSEKGKILQSLSRQGDTPDANLLIQKLQKGRISMADLGGAGARLPRLSSRDEYLFYLAQRSFRLEQEAQTAKVLHSQSASQGTAFVGFQGAMEEFSNKAKSRATISRGAALSRLKALASDEIREIQGVLQKMQIVEAELIQQLALSDRLIKDNVGLNSKQKGTTGSSRRFTLKFPQDGEVWFDEISNYKVDVAKGCEVQKGI